MRTAELQPGSNRVTNSEAEKLCGRSARVSVCVSFDELPRRNAVEFTSKDQLITYKQAADALGLPYFKIQRAGSGGVIPTYTLFNGRKYVKMRDILELIEKGRVPAKSE